MCRITRCRWLATSLTLLITIALAACGGGGAPTPHSAPGDFFVSLPNGLHGASTVEQVLGAAYTGAGAGVTPNGSAAVLNALALDYSYTLYAYNAPAENQVRGFEYNLSAVSSACWLGVANYTLGKWDWREITASAGSGSVDFDDPQQYLAPDGNVYWVVVASHGHSVQVDSFNVDYQSSVQQMIFNPPAGQHTVDSVGLGPQTVLMPALPSTGGAVAPVVVYTKTVDSQSQLTLGYYGGAGWEQLGLYRGRSFSLPQARWLTDEGVVVAFDATNNQLLEIRVDQWWEINSETAIPLPTSAGLIVPSLISMDLDPATGRLGVAYATAGDPARVYYSAEGESGWSEPVLVAEYTGETIPGLSFKFDPAGGAPWLVFTHGVAQYDATMTVDYAMEFGRFNGASWDLSPANRPNSPFMLELGFDGTTPKLVFSEVRQGTVTVGFPPFFSYDIDVPLLADVFVGAYDGADWEYERVFESDIDNSFDFATMILTLDLNLAPACGWAGANMLYYDQVTGSVDLLVAINGGSPTVTPQGGTLTNTVPLMADTGSGYAPISYFTGDPGMNFSWAERLTGGLVCSYVFADQVSVEDIMGGQLFSENTLLYWAKPIPAP